MGKFVYAVMMVFAIEMALWMFGGTTYSSSSLFGIIQNPESILSNPLYLVVVAAFVAFAASAIIPLNTWQVNIYALYAGIATALITFVLSISHLFSFIYGSLNATALGDTMALQITMLICAPFLVFYLIAVTEWVRAN